MKARQIKQTIVANRIVREFPQDIADKLQAMGAQIDELKTLLAEKEDRLEELTQGIETLEHPAIQVLRTEIDDLQSKLANANARNLERQLVENREQEKIADLERQLKAALLDRDDAKEETART
jgi:chromosome segregation ATPase